MRRFLLPFALLLSVGAFPVLPASAASKPLESVTVTGQPGEKPVIEISEPLKVKTSVTDVISEGTGEEAVKGAKLTFDYVVVNGRTGEEIQTSFGSSPATLVLDKKRAQKVFVKSLVGTTVGSRVLLAVAPKEGLAKSTQVSGVKRSDTLLFYFDIHDSTIPLSRATGAPVEPVEGLPTVTLGKSGEPTIEIPEGVPAPGTLVVQPLIEGDGPVVEAGQTISVHYTGVIWDSGKTFDSSWSRGTPVDFGIGTGQVIAGWDEGLVGQKVGSQVLLVVPPDKGYGAGGNTQAGIAGTDTLVFVVDILDAS